MVKSKKNNFIFYHIPFDIACFLHGGISSDRNNYPKALKEQYQALVKNQFITDNEAKSLYKKAALKFQLKNYIRKIVGPSVSNRISLMKFQKLNSTHTKLIYDMSIQGATRAGVYVFAFHIHEELEKSIGNKMITFKNVFSSIGKESLWRKINSFLRLIVMEFIVFYGKKNDIFFFPAPEVPFSILLSKRKYIVTIHDLYSWKNSNKTTVFARFKNKLLPLIVQKAMYVATVSQFSKEEIIKYLNVKASDIVILPNGLDRRYTMNDDKHVISGLKNKKYILNVGSLEPRKNIEFLIDIFDLLKDKYYKDLKLVLTGGESWCTTNILHKINMSSYKKDIIILGNVELEALPWLYEQAQVMVFPSKEEGFGIPIIESLSQGTPALVQNNSAVKNFKEFGAIVMEDYDVLSWVNTIHEIIDNEVRIDKDLVFKVKEHFNWEKSAKVLVETIWTRK
ncbi:glycosyltransferase family 1 protein [Sulfurovum sp. AR]|uniref:glycosyltransferase family 4 protein n=1 Tax=Sulfurovum sp. AR TaxID=1165841 RepID=UPI00025C4EBA|nr:glycosyltransferase family 1 protein [Sulfurovum sp. AR]EIF50096.1 group 1 glycosyl transferase [Sulfurovum sp. AR]